MDQTIVKEFEINDEILYENMLKMFAIGTGVIIKFV